MNPWLQRFLVSWAAGIAATGAVVSTARRPGKLKRRKRAKRPGADDEPVQVGAVALRDARDPDEHGLSMTEWRAGMVASARGVRARITAALGRPAGRSGQASDAAREPDDVQQRDGKPVRPSRPRQQPARASARKKARTKPRRQRQHATLWDSAKESLRQTVKETVREEVKASPVGTALDALKTVGTKVKEGAASAASVAQTVLHKALEPNDVAPPRDLNAPPAPSSSTMASTSAPTPEPTRESTSEWASSRSPSVASSSAHEAPSSPVLSMPSEDPGSGPQVGVDVDDVARKLKAGASAVGSWLQGSGAPGYTSRRVRPAGSAGDVVEARDAVVAAHDGVEGMGAESPVAEPPIAEPPIAESPIAEPPIAESPIAESPTAEPPVAEPPVAESPVAESPVVESPVVESPVVESPVVESPVVESPVVESPVVESPIVEVNDSEAHDADAVVAGEPEEHRDAAGPDLSPPASEAPASTG